MFKKLATILVLGIFALTLGGCATAQKQKDTEIQGLKERVSMLESELQSREDQINDLKLALAQTGQDQGIEKLEAKSRPTMKQIQTALKNAGFDPGPIDGKKGKKTREAIKAFQKQNNLTVDGKVGKDTWELLRKYLEIKVK